MKISRAAAIVLGAAALLSVVLLLAWDAIPERFPEQAHLLLGAIPLAGIALAYMVYQGAVRPRRDALLRAVILAVAFLCWAENQLLGDGQLSTLFNDLAIALFVLDVFLTMIGWPSSELL